MAQSAIRNLNGHEFSGRTLRVDKASSQADELRMIHQQTGGPPVENPYGENISPDKAPEGQLKNFVGKIKVQSCSIPKRLFKTKSFLKK